MLRALYPDSLNCLKRAQELAIGQEQYLSDNLDGVGGGGVPESLSSSRIQSAASSRGSRQSTAQSRKSPVPNGSDLEAKIPPNTGDEEEDQTGAKTPSAASNRSSAAPSRQSTAMDRQEMAEDEKEMDEAVSEKQASAAASARSSAKSQRSEGAETPVRAKSRQSTSSKGRQSEASDAQRELGSARSQKSETASNAAEDPVDPSAVPSSRSSTAKSRGSKTAEQSAEMVEGRTSALSSRRSTANSQRSERSEQGTPVPPPEESRPPSHISARSSRRQSPSVRSQRTLGGEGTPTPPQGASRPLSVRSTTPQSKQASRSPSAVSGNSQASVQQNSDAGSEANYQNSETVDEEEHGAVLGAIPIVAAAAAAGAASRKSTAASTRVRQSTSALRLLSAGAGSIADDRHRSYNNSPFGAESQQQDYDGEESEAESQPSDLDRNSLLSAPQTPLNNVDVRDDEQDTALVVTKSSDEDKMADAETIKKCEDGYKKLQASDSRSLLKKHLTEDVLNACKGRKTKLGATLLDVIQSGVANLDSGVGIYAPDAESYTLFKELFNPVIEEYHNGFGPQQKQPATDLGEGKISEMPELDPEGKYIQSTRIRCGRSLAGYPFNPCLTKGNYEEMETKVKAVFDEISEAELTGKYYPLLGMTKEVQTQLIADHFLFKEGDRFLQTANACRYWPVGRGIFHNKEKTFLVWVNEEDHLRIISMQQGGHVGQVLERLIKGVKTIETKVPFSRDDRLGWLTFCPTNLGTTVRASVHIKLPNVSSRSDFKQITDGMKLQVRGIHGEHSDSEGGVYDISNKARLGLTEYEAVKQMYDGVKKLIEMEQAADDNNYERLQDDDCDDDYNYEQPYAQITNPRSKSMSCILL